MKKYIFLVVLFSSVISFSQSINDYKYAIVPSKFSFVKEKDAYRLNSLTKLFMEKYGFITYYDTDVLPVELANNNCDKVYVNVLSNGNMFTTKITVEIKDCQNKVLFASLEGKSREKEYAVAYNQALRAAFSSLDNLGYRYIEKSKENNNVNENGNNNNVNTNETSLFAQPIANGFQLIDTVPKVIMKIYKTSNTACFIAVRETISGVLISKENQWFFEHYENDKLISERINIQF